MRNTLLMLTLIMLVNTTQSQEHASIEQYYYTAAEAIVPKVCYQTRGNWYGEMRYNDAELRTVSFNAGKKFSNKRSMSFSITPFAGVVLGRLNGGTVGSNIETEHNNLFFTSESYYTFSVENSARDFFFNWSEAGYQFADFAYAGFALQLMHPYEIKNAWEAGIMMGLTYRNWTFPVYAFSPAGKNQNFVLGVNWEWIYIKTKHFNK